VENRPAEEAPLLVARPFANKAPSRRIALVWRRTLPRIKAVQALREAILASPMRGVNFLPDAQATEG
jgi:LysR family transcriptional regulator, hydrogen peroxide-inducible genes activator